MRLSKIKLAGFKSFVDPTSIILPSNLVGVVGPNGCGKSNTIDAVRWVMGESSAKHLRGSSMEDVIFSGSNARKPVGQASVELIFDNHDGSVGGEFASYAEISVRRQVGREGQSNYYLNGSRCRRRDITDIFLGTGLGPRSYAIIEQGMISQLIEAKPEDLRVYIEEAAGISKYRERRRETENRIRHTRDNLDRLDDLREEVKKQIGHLKRQARTAKRFKGLKIDERRARAELLVLRRVEYSATLATQDQRLRETETELEKCIADQRAAESTIEKQRVTHSEANNQFNTVQGQFYKLGADISRSEQTIQHSVETRQRQQFELQQLEQTWSENNQLILQDREKIRHLSESIEDDSPAYQRLLSEQKDFAEMLAGADQAMLDWQNQWEDYTRRNAEPLQIAQVERSRTEQIERHIETIVQRSSSQTNALNKLAGGDLGSQIETLIDEEAIAVGDEEKFVAALAIDTRAVTTLREQQDKCQRSLDESRTQAQTTLGRLASLEALQQAAMGEHDGRSSEWLAHRGLADRQRLAQHLNVQSGWELAVETVLEGYLEAICVDQLPDGFADFGGGRLTFLDAAHSGNSTPHGTATLRDKVTATIALPEVLSTVHLADNYSQALAMRNDLQPGESVVTADGIWLGSNWLRINRGQGEDTSILVRGQELKSLRVSLDLQQITVSSLESDNANIALNLQSAEQRRDAAHESVNQAHRAVVEVQSRLNALRVRQEQVQQNRARLQLELSDLETQHEQYLSELEASRERHAHAMNEVDVLAAEGRQLSSLRETLREQLDHAREQSRQRSEHSQELAIRVESMRTALQATEQNLARIESQVSDLEARRKALQVAEQQGDGPILVMKEELAALLARRLEVEKSLIGARKAVENVEASLRTEEQNRLHAEQAAQMVRDTLEGDRLASQEVRVRIVTLDENLAETEFKHEDLLEELPADASVPVWTENLETIETRIQRLGPINLAAIDEHTEQETRQQYLDKQYADVTEALATLETAIEKIDRETRSRFKETFEKVNILLQGYFPRLFGGGHANLVMTGNDLLNTGVSVVARPPGKRVSSINLLSGGEKALTAVALVFAFFDLNPAPFCMLDEVDAPLDDANVARYCELVREMSERVQFIFITHNKLTMELSEHLMGVTMHEPGVSRLVSVDIGEATRLAEAG